MESFPSQTPQSNMISFHTPSQNKLKILTTVNVNQLTNDPTNSLLKIKVNPHTPEEFLIINSNFTMNYFSISNQNTISSLGVYAEHKDRINDVAFFKNSQPPFDKSFFSADNSGNILLWDSRAKKSSFKLSSHGKGGVLTLDTNESFLCAGYDHEISLWDLKTMKQVGKSSFAHSEDVTCVRFKDNYLITGSEDNIINIFNINNTSNTSETNLLTPDNVEMTLNLEQSVYSFDAFETDYLSVITTVNTFNIMSLVQCTSQYEFDAKSEVYSTDYIWDTFYDKEKKCMDLLCGSYRGNIVMLKLDLALKAARPSTEAVINTGIEQCFNSVGRWNKNVFMLVSDQGWLYVVQRSEFGVNADDIWEIDLWENDDGEAGEDTGNKCKIQRDGYGYEPY